LNIHTYINQVITEWKEVEIKGIKSSGNEDIKTLLFVDDQVIVVDPKDALQISVYNLETISSKYRLKISTSKAKTMVFQGTDQ